MRTEESFLTEYQVLAENIVFDFTLRYKKAIKQDPKLSAYNFFQSNAKEFQEQLAGTATDLLHKSVIEGIGPDLTLTAGFQRISHESTQAFIAALLRS